MSIVIGIVVPAILFLITLPLQSFLFITRQRLKLEENKIKKSGKGSLRKNLKLSWGSDTLKERLGLNKTVKDKSDNSKLNLMSIKSLQVLLRGISGLISFLRTLASSLIGLVITSYAIIIPVCLAVVVGASSIVLLMDSDGSSTTVNNNIITSTNVVDSNKNASGWVGSIEKMANWYLANISTYQGGNKARVYYPCDLVGGKTVADDCTGFSYACLVYAGLIIDSPSSAPSSSTYVGNGTTAVQLESAGFTHGTITNDTVFQAGDILAKVGHVEIVVGVNDDGTYQTFGWGKVQKAYPSTPVIRGVSLTSEYTDYFRLK